MEGGFTHAMIGMPCQNFVGASRQIIQPLRSCTEFESGTIDLRNDWREELWPILVEGGLWEVVGREVFLYLFCCFHACLCQSFQVFHLGVEHFDGIRLRNWTKQGAELIRDRRSTVKSCVRG